MTTLGENEVYVMFIDGSITKGVEIGVDDTLCWQFNVCGLKLMAYNAYGAVSSAVARKESPYETMSSCMGRGVIELCSLNRNISDGVIAYASKKLDSIIKAKKKLNMNYGITRDGKLVTGARLTYYSYNIKTIKKFSAESYVNDFKSMMKSELIRLKREASTYVKKAKDMESTEGGETPIPEEPVVGNSYVYGTVKHPRKLMYMDDEVMSFKTGKIIRAVSRKTKLFTCHETKEKYRMSSKAANGKNHLSQVIGLYMDKINRCTKLKPLTWSGDDELMKEVDAKIAAPASIL